MSLRIETHGSGPVQLVLIHGWAMHGGVLQPLVDALAGHCTMHVVDLPGHGYSRDCGLPLEPHACAAAIAAVTPPAIWLGWSLGGLVALTVEPMPSVARQPCTDASECGPGEMCQDSQCVPNLQ